MSLQEHDIHVQPKVTLEHDLRISILKRESRVQQTVSKCDLRVSLQKRETRVQQEAGLERDPHVSLLKCESRIQPQVAKFSTDLGSPHPYKFEANSFCNRSDELFGKEEMRSSNRFSMPLRVTHLGSAL